MKISKIVSATLLSVAVSSSAFADIDGNIDSAYNEYSNYKKDLDTVEYLKKIRPTVKDAFDGLVELVPANNASKPIIDEGVILRTEKNAKFYDAIVKIFEDGKGIEFSKDKIVGTSTAVNDHVVTLNLGNDASSNNVGVKSIVLQGGASNTDNIDTITYDEKNKVLMIKAGNTGFLSKKNDGLSASDAGKLNKEFVNPDKGADALADELLETETDALEAKDAAYDSALNKLISDLNKADGKQEDAFKALGASFVSDVYTKEIVEKKDGIELTRIQKINSEIHDSKDALDKALTKTELTSKIKPKTTKAELEKQAANIAAAKVEALGANKTTSAEVKNEIENFLNENGIVITNTMRTAIDTAANTQGDDNAKKTALLKLVANGAGNTIHSEVAAALTELNKAKTAATTYEANIDKKHNYYNVLSNNSMIVNAFENIKFNDALIAKADMDLAEKSAGVDKTKIDLKSTALEVLDQKNKLEEAKDLFAKAMNLADLVTANSTKDVKQLAVSAFEKAYNLAKEAGVKYSEADAKKIDDAIKAAKGVVDTDGDQTAKFGSNNQDTLGALAKSATDGVAVAAIENNAGNAGALFEVKKILDDDGLKNAVEYNAKAKSALKIASKLAVDAIVEDDRNSFSSEEAGIISSLADIYDNENVAYILAMGSDRSLGGTGILIDGPGVQRDNILANDHKEAFINNLKDFVDVTKNSIQESIDNSNKSLGLDIVKFNNSLSTRTRLAKLSNPFNENIALAEAISKLESDKFADNGNALADVVKSYTDRYNYDNNLWASILGSKAKGKHSSSLDLYGVSLGYDKAFDNTIVGGFATYAKTKAESELIKSKADNYQLGVYTRSFVNNNEFDFKASISTANNKIDREIKNKIYSYKKDAKNTLVKSQVISYKEFNQNATQKSLGFDLAFDYGYVTSLSDSLFLKYIAGLELSHSKSKGFEESGDIAASFSAQKRTNLDLKLGTEFRKYVDNGNYVYITPGIDAEIYKKSSDVKVKFANSKDIIFKADDKKRVYFTLLTGADFKLTNSLSTNINFGTKLGKDNKYYSGNIGLKYKF